MFPEGRGEQRTSRLCLKPEQPPPPERALRFLSDVRGALAFATGAGSRQLDLFAATSWVLRICAPAVPSGFWGM